MIWYTADLHIGHKNIIEYCKRPFTTTDQMWETIKKNWNERVKPEDTVYVLGDVSFRCGPVELRMLISQLNGTKILISGNHEMDRGRYRSAGFVSVLEGALIYIGRKNLVRLSHFPYQGSSKYQYSKEAPTDDGGWLLCGHVHEKWKQINKMINVGVDVWNFAPVPEGKIIQLIDEYNLQHDPVEKKIYDAKKESDE